MIESKQVIKKLEEILKKNHDHYDETNTAIFFEFSVERIYFQTMREINEIAFSDDTKMNYSFSSDINEIVILFCLFK